MTAKEFISQNLDNSKTLFTLSEGELSFMLVNFAQIKCAEQRKICADIVYDYLQFKGLKLGERIPTEEILTAKEPEL